MDGDAQRAQYFAGMWPHLDERARRLVAASQAVELGYGGISIAGTTTAKGLKMTCRLDHRKYPVGRRVTDDTQSGRPNNLRAGAS
jgi:hypothetical protein